MNSDIYTSTHTHIYVQAYIHTDQFHHPNARKQSPSPPTPIIFASSLNKKFFLGCNHQSVACSRNLNAILSCAQQPQASQKACSPTDSKIRYFPIPTKRKYIFTFNFKCINDLNSTPSKYHGLVFFWHFQITFEKLIAFTLFSISEFFWTYMRVKFL